MLVEDTHRPQCADGPVPRMEALHFHFPSGLLAPRPAALPGVAVVKEFAKVPLSGLVHAPPSSPPEPDRASPSVSPC